MSIKNVLLNASEQTRNSFLIQFFLQFSFSSFAGHCVFIVLHFSFSSIIGHQKLICKHPSHTTPHPVSCPYIFQFNWNTNMRNLITVIFILFFNRFIPYSLVWHQRHQDKSLQQFRMRMEILIVFSQTR